MIFGVVGRGLTVTFQTGIDADLGGRALISMPGRCERDGQCVSRT